MIVVAWFLLWLAAMVGVTVGLTLLVGGLVGTVAVIRDYGQPAEALLLALAGGVLALLCGAGAAAAGVAAGVWPAVFA